MGNWSLRQYRSVFDEFYQRDCDEDTRDAIDQRLARLLEEGNMARAPVSKHLEDGIFELRAKNARMLYYFDTGRLIVVAVCFLKDQPKVPRKHIEQAKRIRGIISAGQERTSGTHFTH